MPIHEPIDLLTEVKESADEYKHAIFGTYTFDALFFEMRLLPILQQKDVENILVLLDRTQYDQAFSDMKLAGMDYYIDHCLCAKTFHPKFVLLIGDNETKLFVGSANINEHAWMKSAELSLNIECSSTKKDPIAVSILLDMKKFLMRLLEKGLLQSRKHQQKLREALDDLSWLDNNAANQNKVKLLHNLDSSIFSQAFREIGNDKILESKIFAPFFDTDGTVLKQLITNGCSDISVFVQPENVVGFPKESIIKLKNTRNNIRVFSLYFKSEESRFIHAKALLLKSANNSYCITGSANPTRAGSLSSCDDGNVELCALRIENDTEYFDYLLDSEIFQIKNIEPESVEERPTQKLTDKKSAVRVVDARLEKRVLIIELENQYQSQSAQISLWHHEEERPRTYLANVQGKVISIELDEEGYSFCAKPTFITLQIEVNNQKLESERRWISTEALENRPRGRDMEKIQKSNGRHGLISFLYDLERMSESPEWFLYYLQWIKFDKLGGSLEDIRARLKRSRNNEENGDEELPPRPCIDALEILNKLVNRHRKHLDTIIENLQIDQNFPVTMENIFNLVLAINKLTLWFVLTEKSTIAELRHIRSNIENLVSIIRRLRENPSVALDPLLNELYFWEHLVVLCFITHREHIRTGYANMTFNKNVISVFHQTYDDIIQMWDRQSFQDNTERITEAIKEYEEFGNLKIRSEDIIQFCKERK